MNLTEQFHRWRYDFEGFVDWLFPDITLTHQQRQALNEFSKLVSAKLKKSSGKELTKEEEFYASKIGLSIMGGHGCGKDTFAAILLLSFMMLFPYCKNIATANTAKQLSNVLWSEISKCKREFARKINGKSIFDNFFVFEKEKIYMKAFGSNEWFTEAVTVSVSRSEEEQAESIAGRHEDNQLVIVDEASGIADAVFKKLERTLTRRLNLIVIIFNPTRSTGYAIDSQNDDRFIAIRWNSEDSPLVSSDWLESMRRRYSPDDNSYRVGVLGLPPRVDEDVFFQWDWIEDAMLREIEMTDSFRMPLIFGVDCGGGGDKSIVAVRRGYNVLKFFENSSSDPIVVANWIGSLIDTYNPDTVRIDTIGLGWAIEGMLREKKGAIIEAADSRRMADNSSMFFNKRAEMYYNLREMFSKGLISLNSLSEPEKMEIKFQLGSIKTKLDGKGRIQIVEKKAIKDKLGHSPDEADALALTCFYSDTFVSRVNKKQAIQLETLAFRKDAWMMS